MASPAAARLPHTVGMELLDCGHVAVAGPARMCRHLIGPETEFHEHARHLTGRGLDADLYCPACDRDPRAADLVTACEGCFDRHEFGCIAWRGTPGIPSRPEPVPTELTTDRLPESVVDIAPVSGSPRSVWLLLTAAGDILRLDDGTVTARAPGIAKGAGRHLHCSAGGRFAAVVDDHGHRGVVADLETGRVTLTLDGGRGHEDTVPFSVAFSGDHVVHRIDWNLLVVSDARTGAVLHAQDGVDYFHGALHVSPSGRWVADDGWVWAPVGIPRVWDMRLTVYTDLCQRAYHWTSPMCWIGDDLLAVSGIGDDDLALLPGVRIFDAPTGAELTAFAGPRGALFAAGRRLYGAAPDGLEVWNPFTGERTGRVPGFVPRWHHRGAAELAAISDGELVRWRLG